MNRSRIVMTLMLALVVAGLASFLVFKQLNRLPVKANVAVRRVVMAAKDLNVGGKLAEEDVRLAEGVVGEPPKRAFFKGQDANGQAGLYPPFNDVTILCSRLACTDPGAR